MNRRNFLGLGLAAAGGVFVPRFGHWFRLGSGLIVPPPPQIMMVTGCAVALTDVMPKMTYRELVDVLQQIASAAPARRARPAPTGSTGRSRRSCRSA